MSNSGALDFFFKCCIIFALVVVVGSAITGISFLRSRLLTQDLPELRRRYDIAVEKMKESDDSVEREVWTEEVDKYSDAIQDRLRADTEKLVAKAYKKDAKSHE